MHSDTATAATGSATVRRVSWGAIFAGTVVAMALMVIFSVLGIALGASAIDPLQGNSGGIGAGAGFYTIVTQILSLVAGGYVAARLAGVPRLTASLLHGASVWALSTVLLAWVAAAGAGALFNAASSVLTTTARGAVSAVQTVVPEDISFPDVSQVVGQVSIEDLPDPLQTTLQENGVTLDNLRQEVRQAFSEVVSQQERQEAIDLMQSTLADAVRSPGDIGEDLNQALDTLVSGPNGILSQEDRQEVANALQRRLGVTPDEAGQILQATEDRVAQAISQVRQTIDELQAQAVESAEAAAAAISTTAWWLFFASLLGIAAAMGGAFLGKPDGILGDRLDDRYA